MCYVAVIDEAKKFAMEMADKYLIPPFAYTAFAVKKGQEISKRLKADENLVALGCYLMDIELGRAIHEGRQDDHVKMGVETARSFLGKFNLPEDYQEKVLNCIAAHHGQAEHTCVESEIVKNADCFKFLDPNAILIPIYYHSDRGSLHDTVNVLKAKIEEKHDLISLDTCKEEAESDYKIVKQFLDKLE